MFDYRIFNPGAAAVTRKRAIPMFNRIDTGNPKGVQDKIRISTSSIPGLQEYVVDGEARSGYPLASTTPKHLRPTLKQVPLYDTEIFDVAVTPKHLRPPFKVGDLVRILPDKLAGDGFHATQKEAIFGTTASIRKINGCLDSVLGIKTASFVGIEGYEWPCGHSS